MKRKTNDQQTNKKQTNKNKQANKQQKTINKQIINKKADCTKLTDGEGWKGPRRYPVKWPQSYYWTIICVNTRKSRSRSREQDCEM